MRNLVMDSEELELCRQELKEIEINLENIRKQYERNDDNVVEVFNTFDCHIERISNMSKWQKQFIDVEILKLVIKKRENKNGTR